MVITLHEPALPLSPPLKPPPPLDLDMVADAFLFRELEGAKL